MKKLIIALLTLSFFINPINCFADEKTTVTKEYLGDGIYVETYVIDHKISCFATNTVSKTKVSDYKNSKGTLIYRISVTGTFTYNGTSATCTASSVNAETYLSDWKVVSKSASKSGNTASATAIFSQYLNGHLIQSKNPTITLTCSATGVVS